MDQVKIGKFIAELRKSKNMTQQQLADKLGVSFKTVSKWETGRGLPELSTLKPLSEILEITLNELLSGERIESEKVAEKAEKSIISTIDYTKQKIEKEHKKISLGLIIAGIVISISAFTIFEKESSWCSIYSIIGIIVLIIGVIRELKHSKNVKVIISLVLCIGIFTIYYGIDYVGVQLNHRVPIYRYLTITRTDKTEYCSLLYNIYRINSNTPNEYYIIDNKKEYTIDTVPISPFNKTRSGIDNIIKYKNKYVGNNSNIGNLLYNLPLSEYGLAFEVDLEKYGITVDYNTTDWYNNENLYIEKGLIYNSVSIFLLIDNVEYIEYNFSGSSYKITRKQIEREYPNYLEIKQDNINKDNFNRCVEQRMNDYDFVQKQFETLFNKK